jgi:hypothetical protein
MFNFDLTNPDEVVKMLESVNLTDEDTDVLLQEAEPRFLKLFWLQPCQLSHLRTHKQIVSFRKFRNEISS